MTEPSSSNKHRILNYVIGAAAIVSIGLLLYALTRPTIQPKKKQSSKQKDKEKTKKITVTFKKKPIDIHLEMETMDAFNACVAADLKNKKAKLKYGAQLSKINKTKISDFSYETIIEILQKAKTPIKLQFFERDDLCEQWTKAYTLKDASNQKYKSGKVEEAIKILNEAILLHPTNKVFHANRVLMCLKVRDLKTAMNDCKYIRELDPKSLYVKGHYLRGLVLIQMKRYKAAAAAFQTVIKLSPQMKSARDKLNECLTVVFGDTMIMEKYHFVDQRTRDLVNWYIRNSQQVFDAKDTYFNIDVGINKIIAIFLYEGNLSADDRRKLMQINYKSVIPVTIQPKIIESEDSELRKLRLEVQQMKAEHEKESIQFHNKIQLLKKDERARKEEP